MGGFGAFSRARAFIASPEVASGATLALRRSASVLAASDGRDAANDESGERRVRCRFDVWGASGGEFGEAETVNLT
jgi:hypothetical protein